MLMFKQQEIDFLCTARVSRVESDKGWCYVACSKCSKKLQRTVTSFECARCNNPHAVGSLRYRVEMVVTDDTAEGTFVCFDGVMTKLHNLRARMEGKTYTFQVRVTPYNFTVNHQTFTVSRIINEVERAPAPEFVDDEGDDNDDDDAPDGPNNRVESGSGKGNCETSKRAGKEPVGNVRKRARIA
ncbi:hypothetical protein BRARA_K01849 [Brassica rapa]|uniref:Replication factor A C-terminal domain-containing protein n=1 Tax=Brassica campestris TaxID=3711 RepID=A0A397KUY5_BRACM|nr:hypothetical protein BRARA_K01849 [Brassica rapa]